MVSSVTVRRTPLALIFVALGCVRRGNTPSPRILPPAEATAVMVRARAAYAMPRCTAGTPVVIAVDTSASRGAMPVIARTPAGHGLVAYVSDLNGHSVIKLAAMGSMDHETTDPVVLPDAGESPDAPALAVHGDGFVLAWRAGPEGHQHIALRMLDAQGVLLPPVPSPQQSMGWLGAPAVTVSDGTVWVAFARSAEAPVDPEAFEGGSVMVVGSDGTMRDTPAPAGGAYDDAPPLMVPTHGGVRVFATVAKRGEGANGERALVRLPDVNGVPPVLIARDLDHTAALPSPTGTLLAWRSRVARHDAAVRVMLLGADDTVTAPPITVGTWRGAYDAMAALVPMGSLGDLGETVGVFTASTLSDDTDGSINVSLVTAGGEYVGRAPIVTGFTARSARIAVADAGEGEAWVVMDSRSIHGAAIALARVRCDASTPMDRLDVPPPTMVQNVAEPDAPPASLASPGAAAMTCTPHGEGTLATHVSLTADALAGTSSAAVALAGGRTVLMAVARSRADAAPTLQVGVLGAQGVGMVRPWGAATAILAAERVGDTVIAVIEAPSSDGTRAELVTVTAAGVVARKVLGVLRHPTSAAVVSANGMAFVSARDALGDVSLYRVGRTGTTVRLAPLRPGDEVRDAMQQDAHERAVLLERADALGEDVARTIARFGDVDAATVEGLRGADPFANPLGFPRGPTAWAVNHTEVAVLSNERSIVRIGTVSSAGLNAGRSVFGVLPGGGRLLSTAWAGTQRWLAVATGTPDDGSPRGAVTVAVLGQDGALRGLTDFLRNDGSAVPDGAALAVSESASSPEVTLVYPRVMPAHDGTPAGLTWRWSRSTCTVPGGGR